MDLLLGNSVENQQRGALIHSQSLLTVQVFTEYALGVRHSLDQEDAGYFLCYLIDSWQNYRVNEGLAASLP